MAYLNFGEDRSDISVSERIFRIIASEKKEFNNGCSIGHIKADAAPWGADIDCLVTGGSRGSL